MSARVDNLTVCRNRPAKISFLNQISRYSIALTVGVGKAGRHRPER